MSDLHALAEAAGIQVDWTDAGGRAQRVTDDALADVLAALGINSLNALRAEQQEARASFVSGEQGEAIVLAGGGRGRLHLASGGGVDVDGHVPPVDEPGYHRLDLGDREMTVAIAPQRCFTVSDAGRRRVWGPAVQIPALRDGRNTAFGDFAALAHAAVAFGKAGANLVAISPVHALFPADPTRYSPYAPSSRLFLNILFADPGLVGHPVTDEDAPDLIDWTAAIPQRLAKLRTAFDARTSQIDDAIAAFASNGGDELERHARYDALHAHFFGQGAHGWQDWPAAYHDPAGDAVSAFAREHPDEVAFYRFCQWLADRSLAEAQRAAKDAGMALGLVADLAVGMDAGGSHAWSAREELLTGLTVGAPPDPLGPDGQNWGITALDPFALERTGFRAFIDTLRVALAHAGGIRIDHALGLERLWVIPAGEDASRGAYLKMPGDHLRRIVAIEAHRAEAVVIAEDLGTVPPGFRDTLAERCMLGMRVLPFERDEDGGFVPPAAWDEAAVAMTGTHDTPTLAGWWKERDIDWAEQLGRSGADRARRGGERAALWHAMGKPGDPPVAAPVDAMIAHVASAPCPLAIVPLEDLLGLEEQPNLPGTIDEHPNWRRRMDAPTAALLARRDVARRAALLNAERPA